MKSATHTRASRELRTKALEVAANAIVITDIEGTIVWTNPAFSRLTGYSADEVLGKQARILKSGSHLPAFYQNMWRTILSGTVWRGEVTNRRKDGGLYVEEMTITPVSANNRDITHFIAIKIDATQRKRAEEALVRSETVLRSLVRDAPYGIFRSTGDGKILSANPALCRMLGYASEAELMAIKLGDIYQDRNDRVTLVNQCIEMLVLSNVETRWTKKDGTPLTVSLSARFSLDKGETTFEVFVEDITRSVRDRVELHHLNRVLSALRLCNRALVHARDEVQLLTDICNIVVGVGGYRMAWVGYADKDDVTVEAKAGSDDGYIEDARSRWTGDNMGQRPTGVAIRRGETCVINDIPRDPRFAPWRDQAVSHNFASLIALPLKDRKQTFGVLTIYASEPEAFDKQERESLRELAEDLSNGIMALRTEAERRVAEEALIRAEEKYRAIFEEAVIGIFQTDPEGHPLNVNPALARLHGYDSPEHLLSEAPDITRLFVNPNQFKEVAKRIYQGESVRGAEIEVLRRDGTTKWVAVNVRGVRDSENTVVHHEGTVEDITERKVAQERVNYLAYYDPLTGLPNRALFQDRLTIALAEARRRGDSLAVMFFDLDRFKIINDSLGHSFGDLILQQVAHRLSQWSREGDILARVGGDEFLIVMPRIHDAHDAAAAAERLMNVMSADFSVMGRVFNVACSIGISIFPDNGEDGEALVKNADAAMYSAKESGRKQFRFFTQDMNDKVVEKLTIENALRESLADDMFYLLYQPQIDFRTGKIMGWESLLRTRHTALGNVSVSKLIETAESSGLILPIGEFVLRTACAQLQQWRNQGLPLTPVAANVSATQLYDHGFPGLVSRLLQQSRIPPEYLELELTESAFISNMDIVCPTLDALRAAGVKLAIDDFGTGYCSFSYLKRFRVDKLKIDKSFIEHVLDNNDVALITTAIINLARSLNITAVAEGVEKEEQLAFLRARDCNRIQGYWFSKPLTANEATAVLQVPSHFGAYGGDDPIARVEC